MSVRVEKILCMVLHEAHERQVEKTMGTLSEELERFLSKSLSLAHDEMFVALQTRRRSRFEGLLTFQEPPEEVSYKHQ